MKKMKIIQKIINKIKKQCPKYNVKCFNELWCSYVKDYENCIRHITIFDPRY